MKGLLTCLALLTAAVSPVRADQFITQVQHPGDIPVWSNTGGFLTVTTCMVGALANQRKATWLAASVMFQLLRTLRRA